jgi:hypothetical protein
MAKVGTGSAPTAHVAGVAGPSQGPKDPCRHRRSKKKKKYIIYKAPEIDSNGKPTGRYYIGRSSGPATKTVQQIKDARKAKHHRKDIGEPEVVCEMDTYAAIRGAEQKHYDDLGPGKQINAPRRKGRGKQIAPIRADNERKDDYEECAQRSAQKTNSCGICSK